MTFKIVVAALLFIWGVLTLFGVFDKWLLYGDSKAIEEERKQINIKRLRWVSGVALLLAAGFVFFYYEVIIVLTIISLVLRYTWCKKKPEN
ncbi:MAG: hypothetical protein J6X32_10500 [Salinivirgaceae bacterium]|nr:hypothetical protein [Salinivirgaceae bacterium]